jgi:hypothetical protein
MGKIIIELPLDINRRYQLNSVESATLLLQGLEASANLVEENPDTPTAEDLADVRAAKRARREKGFLTIEQLEAELSL